MFIFSQLIILMTYLILHVKKRELKMEKNHKTYHKQNFVQLF